MSQNHTLVTGGAGFIGRHVAGELIARGHQVRLLDAFLGQVHDGASPALPGGAEVVRADIRNRDALDRALKGISGVVHLAAEVGVGQSMYEVARYVGANDLGTAVLLEAVAAARVPRIVVASSMSIYGEGRYVGADGRSATPERRTAESLRRGAWDPTGADGAPLTPVPTDEDKQPDLASIYALTKYAQERAVLIFAEAYGMGAVALRLFNVFGAGQALSNPYTGVLANFAARIAKGERPTVFEDGHAAAATSSMSKTWRAPFADALESKIWRGRCDQHRQRVRPIRSTRWPVCSPRRWAGPISPPRSLGKVPGRRHPQLLCRHLESAPPAFSASSRAHRLEDSLGPLRRLGQRRELHRSTARECAPNWKHGAWSREGGVADPRIAWVCRVVPPGRPRRMWRRCWPG